MATPRRVSDFLMMDLTFGQVAAERALSLMVLRQVCVNSYQEVPGCTPPRVRAFRQVFAAAPVILVHPAWLGRQPVVVRDRQSHGVDAAT